jgi:phosphate transport system substrate-binding protein
MSRWLYTVIVVVIAIGVGLGIGAGIWAGKSAGAATIEEGGSTTVLPLAEKWAAAYEGEVPNVGITTQGGGSSAGVTGVLSGLFDIGAASREIQPSELADGAWGYPVAKDGVALVVDASATHGITQLTMEQVRGIFNGTYTNWNQVGGANQAIVVISRAAGSGTRDTFESIVMNGSEITPTAEEVSSNGEMLVRVGTTPTAIGYLSLGYVDATVRALAIYNEATGQYVACNVTNCQKPLDEGGYPVRRTLYLVTKGEATGAVMNFIQWCRSPAGQEIVGDEGYIPLYTWGDYNPVHA